MISVKGVYEHQVGQVRSGHDGGKEKVWDFSLPGERLVLGRVDAFCVVFDIPVLFSLSR